MACVLAILLTHEMGHFVMTLIYRVRASLPYFIPLPISPIGTMGAVIAMDGRQADRRQIFDIGLAGPLAGLVVAIPIMWIGVQQIGLQPVPAKPRHCRPAAGDATGDRPPASGNYDPQQRRSARPGQSLLHGRLGGPARDGAQHAAGEPARRRPRDYALFGRRAHWIARGFMLLAFVYMGVHGLLSIARRRPGC